MILFDEYWDSAGHQSPEGAEKVEAKKAWNGGISIFAAKLQEMASTDMEKEEITLDLGDIEDLRRKMNSEW